MSRGALKLIEKAFTVIDLYNAVTYDGEKLYIPIIGDVTQIMVDEMVNEMDQEFLALSMKQGYVHLARIMNSSVAKRTGLAGVYVSRAIMQQILDYGFFDTNKHMHYVFDEYPDNPKDTEGNKFDFFIIFPKIKGTIITKFGVMPK